MIHDDEEDERAQRPSALGRALRWFEERPRLWLAARTAGAALGVMTAIGVGALAGAFVGGAAAFVIGGFWVGIGALVGGIWTARRFLGGPPEEDARPREAIARGVVSQAIVARALGQRIRLLRLGLLGGGGLERTRSVSWGRSRTKDGFDELVVLFADPVTHRWSDELDPDWVRRVSEQADLVVAQSALDDTSAHVSGRAELLGRAAQISRDVLGSVPDDVAESIEHELCLAGSMRGQRFELLLDRALAERSADSEADVLRIGRGEPLGPSGADDAA